MTGPIIFALAVVIGLALCGIIRVAMEAPDETPKR